MDSVRYNLLRTYESNEVLRQIIQQMCLGGRTSILIVDDDSRVLRLLTRMLNRVDYAVIACASPLEALDQVSRGEVCVVVSDISMPEMSGFALLSKVREQNPKVPVVLMTGNADTENALLAIEHGAFAFLQKPFDAESFRRTVASAADHYRAARLKHDFVTNGPDHRLSR